MNSQVARRLSRITSMIPRLVLVLALLACGASTGPGKNPIGAYTLQTFNGSPLPGVISQTPTEKDEVRAGYLNLKNDGTWVLDMSLNVTVGGKITYPEVTSGGTWIRSNNAFTLRDNSDGSTASGVFSQTQYTYGRFTFVKGAATFEFEHGCDCDFRGF